MTTKDGGRGVLPSPARPGPSGVGGLRPKVSPLAPRTRALNCRQNRCRAQAINGPSSSSDGSQQWVPRARQLGQLLLTGSTGTAALFALFPSLQMAGGSGDGGSGSPGDGDGGSGGGGEGRHSQPVADVAARSDSDEEEEDDASSSSSSSDDEAEDEDGDGEEEGEEAAAKGDADSDDEEDVDTSNNFFCSDINAQGLPVGKGVPTEDELFAGLKCQPGFDCSRADVSEDLRTLFQTGLFNDVDARVEPLKGKKGKCKLTFVFKEKIWPEMTSFQVRGAKLLPGVVPPRVMEGHEPGPTTVQTLAHIKNIVEGWYADRGYVFGYISHFDGMETGNIIANVVEGRVSSVQVVRVDDQGNPVKGKGQVPTDVIMRELPFKRGQLYNNEDGRRALRDIFALQLFDNVQVVPKQNPKDETKIDVDVVVKERPMRTAEVEAEWGIAPGEAGRPALVSLVPGGTILFEDRNLGGIGRSLSASVSAQNFLFPSDDLSFRVEYKAPYVWGSNDPNKAALTVSAFNARKISGVYSSPSEEVPPVWVDRMGAKLAISESYSRNSKGSLGLVLEQISTRDEAGQLCTHGLRQTGMGTYAADGPPTTLSDSGVDRLLFLQGNLTRDATYFVNGSPVGARDIVTVEQSLLGSGMPMYNRHTAAATRFIKLRDPPAGSKAPPPVLVLHARAGNCIGDMASYDYFLLGGPYSVRGYNVGELATCRSFLETAAELRLPVFGRQAYAFYETGSDLGSSKNCRGNPSQYYSRPGSGSSYGGGVKLGAVRFEYAVDGNAGKGCWFFRFGERF